MANIEDYTKKKWQVNKLKSINKKNLIMIEGLPGMGNVGKIATDFIIENLKAEKVIEIYSHSFPHCVLVNEENLIDLPKIEVYQKSLKDKTLLLIAGDVQPLDEVSCYEFCNILLDTFERSNGKEIITLGGIGQQEVPKVPKLYYTGNTKNMIKKYYSSMLNNDLYGVVGPIMGVSGLLLGLAKTRKIPAISILAETYAHPAHAGLKEAKEILTYLNEKLSLKLDLNLIDDVESNDNNRKVIDNQKLKKMMKKQFITKINKGSETDYIG